VAPTPIPGILFALASALTWGSADFNGGLAARKSNVFQVLFLSSFSGILLLIVCLIGRVEGQPSFASLLWAAASGISGAIGLALFYYGLSLGNTVAVAPTAAVIGAALPVAFGSLSEGTPRFLQLGGFVLAFLGIWFITQSSSTASGTAQSGFWIAVLAGIFFGGFFIFIGQVETGKVFIPLLISRTCELLVALLLLFARKIPFPSPWSNKLALLTGLLDAGGSILFVLAKQFSRLDQTVVLSSLYPVVTVFLAYLLLKEKVSLSQWVGVVLCFSSVVLITI
jgi:drug/metabolite transporter (DMT)-like permease